MPVGQNNVILYHRETDRHAIVLKNELPQLQRCELSEDGRHVLCWSADSSVHLKDVATGRLTPLVPKASLAAFSPNGQFLATVAKDRTVSAWDARSRQQLTTYQRIPEPSQLAISHDGRMVAVATKGGGVLLGQEGKWKDLGNVSIKNGAPRFCTFSGGGGHLVVTADRAAHLWAMPEGRRLGELLLDRPYQSGYVYFSPDETLAATTSGTEFFVWDLATRRIVHRLTGHIDWTQYAEFSPDGRTLATTSSDSVPRLYDVESGLTRHVLRFLGDSGRSVTAARYATNGRWMAVGGDHCASIWDTATGRIVETFSTPEYITQIRFSSDELRLVAMSTDWTIYLWDIVHLPAEANQVATWVEAFTGTRIDGSNQIRPLTAEEWKGCQGQLGRNRMKAGFPRPAGD